MSLLGIDVGTTGCKVVAFSDRGKPLAQASAEYPLEFPRPGWIELDANLVWRKLVACVRSAAAKTKRDPITALAVSAQGEAFMPVDAKGNPLSKSIVTFDARAQSYVNGWQKKLGKQSIFRTTGMPLSAMATLPKIQWLQKNSRAVTKSASYYLCYQDFVAMKLGLPPAIDYSLAARTMAFDVHSLTWSKRMLEAAVVPEEKLARPVASGTVLGDVTSSVARSLGLPAGVLLVAGGHDQPCGALGAGVARSGEAAYAIGTVECITPVFTDPHPSAVMLENNLCYYPHVVPNRFVSLAFNFTGGSLLRWYRDTFGGEYDALVQAISSRPSSLLVLPHFTMTGTPHFDTRSKGMIIGLQLSTSREEITRALLEGITYEMRLNVDLLQQAGVPIRRFRAVGGGSKSAKWMQIKADVMNRPLEVMAVNEASCLGAALLAGIGSGVYETFQEAIQATVKVGRVYEPQSPESRFYGERFELYKQLYPTMQRLLHRI